MCVYVYYIYIYVYVIVWTVHIAVLLQSFSYHGDIGMT